jgi:hypothetical protein
MGRPKKLIQPAPVEPEAEKPEAAEKSISKAEAVRQALSAGMETPEDGVGFIKSNYGIEISKQIWSSYRAQQKARDGKKAEGSSKGKPGRKPAVAKLDQVAKSSQPAVGGSVIGDLAAVKALVEKLGVAEVVEIAKLFG